ncbi:conserved hypothetical protein [Abyssogena phaseoliformis symbiont OG214]|uniref:DUF2189 domain-containing protein n=1 Tax=Abyssogena phaseoliformis symbiont TaxID=596095 RepID=UPI001915D1BA|nr:DUF2189 domain-containing protein [Abyssogena phaseoliformis symbiont]MBW5288759.1 putative cytochrome c oxidase, subunit I [Candidatus Ruthia sp. Apha_13_S6]BBB22243.1 conserved hypothetical protein [Abyssogena phaseoliformis symbiont OG214]
MLQTQRMAKGLNKKARIKQVSYGAPFTWLKQGAEDFMKCPTLALFYGALFTSFTYFYWDFLSNSPTLGDLSAPLLAIVVIIFGPISAMAMYDASKRLSAGENLSLGSILMVIKSAFKANGSCPSLFLSVILIVLAIMWMIFTPLIYAVLNTDTFVNQNQTIMEAILADITSFNNPLFLIVYGVFTAAIAWVSFMISWFSFPMVLDQDVDPFTAANTSIRTALANKIVMLIWVPIVGVIVLASLLTPYFIGMVVAVPILAHATWHAYKSMIGEME